MQTKTTAQRAAGSPPAPGVTPQRVLANLGAAELVEHAIRRNEGQLTDRGVFTAVTSPHTGRSPKDKFVVREADVEDSVWWENNAPLDAAKFDLLLEDMTAHIKGG
jgi:phosphoenolpyruvate carboxykinase (ATP)